ncbi:hypothetical protein BHE74_00000901 [Ensete ventricosum]|nr:hypothetical protein BHE74_00000901 [Ensete ventricosum]
MTPERLRTSRDTKFRPLPTSSNPSPHRNPCFLAPNGTTDQKAISLEAPDATELSNRRDFPAGCDCHVKGQTEIKAGPVLANEKADSSTAPSLLYSRHAFFPPEK